MLDINHHHLNNGRTTKSSPQHSYSARREKSKVRLNDQLIPKPTEINMGEKMIKIAMPKQHPYSSHISKFAMFPSFHPPEDPETGVRAASKPFLSPLIPNRAPDVTVLSKTIGKQATYLDRIKSQNRSVISVFLCIGAPFRHEILESPISQSKKTVMWTGEHGFLDYTKPLKGQNQVFYPTPPKTVLPNPRLCDWDLTLSERTCNMLRNLERTHWLTSYQMNYTGLGPANPLKMDDFVVKQSNPVGMDLHRTLLRERSFPVFVPSKPTQGCRGRQRSCEGRSTLSPAAADHPNLSEFPKHRTASALTNQPRPLETTVKYEAPAPDRKGHSQSKNSAGSTEAPSNELPQEVLHEQQSEGKISAYESGKKGNCKVRFDQSVSQSCQEANTVLITDTEQPLDLYNRPPSHREMEVNREKSLSDHDEPCNKKKNVKVDRNVQNQSFGAKDLAGVESELLCRSYEQEKLVKSKEMPYSTCNPCILPRPSALPDIPCKGTVGTLSLLDLQNSFSKTAAHHNFNSSITHTPVNLRDNVISGKKHNFYGINSCYLHG
ncbi:uncharacterized protein C7orf31 homolog [Xyrichtys novacula]|uniref:Uncharacterized protein C7orf31 homolog n=1 Tax=Xyrichtys novacula TaxID=13765 RepID=A0AAV1FJT4_XYRNO|nr:uncharacterized protein C7orf31 homolog [Xyrichtys novacula]